MVYYGLTSAVHNRLYFLLIIGHLNFFDRNVKKVVSLAGSFEQ